MKRRDMLSAAALALLAPGAVVQAAPGAITYSKAVYDQALASGEAFMLDFYAPW